MFINMRFIPAHCSSFSSICYITSKWFAVGGFRAGRNKLALKLEYKISVLYTMQKTAPVLSL